MSSFYQEPLFRPPSEANSVIVQNSIGCAWNGCHFCDMYKDKTFSYKSKEVLKNDLLYLSQIYPEASRVFLADGDSFAIPHQHLKETITETYKHFPKLKRLSAYASAKSLQKYTPEQLTEIRNSGLSTLYIGIESGNNIVLELINKGISSENQLASILKAKEAGFKLSIMILNGLGGKEYWQQHAIDSAKLVSKIQPHQLSLLTLSFYKGLDFFKSKLKENFEPLTPFEQLMEQRLFIEHCNLNSTVFRSDHASNHLVLKGGLNRDKSKFLQQIDIILNLNQ